MIPPGYKLYSDIDDRQWDQWMLQLPSAHPMQAAAWGEAKARTGARVVRVAVVRDDRPVLMAQAFPKRVTRLRLQMAWIPRGPVGELRDPVATRLLRRGLRVNGVWMAIGKPYMSDARFPLSLNWGQPEETFLLDFERDWAKLEKALRYGRKRFQRDGGVLLEDSSPEAVEDLIRLYDGLVSRKKFSRYGSPDFIREVWRQFHVQPNPEIGVHLFRTMLNDVCCAAAMVLRVKDAAHYMWGAFDYKYRSNRSNEAIQWGVTERMRQLGVKQYDLEGVDKEHNPGSYEFKREMGATLVRLSPFQVIPCY